MARWCTQYTQHLGGLGRKIMGSRSSSAHTEFKASWLFESLSQITERRKGSLGDTSVNKSTSWEK